MSLGSIRASLPEQERIVKDKCGAGDSHAANCAPALQALCGQLMLEPPLGSGDVRTIPPAFPV